MPPTISHKRLSIPLAAALSCLVVAPSPTVDAYTVQLFRQSPFDNVVRTRGVGDEQALTGGPLVTGCYNVELTVQNSKFTVQLDSGSTDLLIPGKGLPAYPSNGPTFDYAGKTAISGNVSSTFADGSSWTGQFYKADVQVVTTEGKALKVPTPVAVMKEQTTNPAVTDGSFSNGLLGIAFDSIASYSGAAPRSFLSALVSSSLIKKDRVAFRGCPATSTSTSYVDWGAEEPDLAACKKSTDPKTDVPGILGWAAVVDAAHYAVDVRAISLTTAGATASVALPAHWQEGLNSDSIVDSCTTILYLPTVAQQALVKAVKASGALKDAGLNAKGVTGFLEELAGVPAQTKIDYTLLPKLTFTLAGYPSGVVNVTLTGKNYIQGDGNGWLYFVVQPSSVPRVILGAVVYDSFYIVMDRANKRVGFGLGCDCNSSENPSTVTSSVLKPGDNGDVSTSSSAVFNDIFSSVGIDAVSASATSSADAVRALLMVPLTCAVAMVMAVTAECYILYCRHITSGTHCNYQNA
ncbi:aspartic peptidase domain-containing protein [Zopfochytrium polystomum]|nr:aspartic peptidase domain-containing protein [Zopfochytrium polystomum]